MTQIKEQVKCCLCRGFQGAGPDDDVWLVIVDPGDTYAVICDTCALSKFPDKEGKFPMRMRFGMLKRQEGVIWMPKTN